MTKADIVKQIAEQTGVQHRQVKAVVQLTFDHIVDALAKDGRIELRDFGVFETRRAPYSTESENGSSSKPYSSQACKI